MTTVALIISGVLILITALLRAAGASLVRTPRADALHDARDNDPRAERIAVLLSDRPRIQPALGLVGTGLPARSRCCPNQCSSPSGPTFMS